MGDVFLVQTAAFAVFQPFFADLIAADMEVPHCFRHLFEALVGVDPHRAVFVGRFFGDAVVALACKLGDEFVDFGGFEQVQGYQFAAEFGEGTE